VQGIVFSLSNISIQSAVNSLGADVMAASSAAFNVEIFVYFVMNAFGQACTTFIGQNVGAGQRPRCRRVLQLSLLLAILLTVALSALILLFRYPVLGIFNNQETVLAYGSTRLFIILTTYWTYAVSEVFSGCMRGFGLSLPPALISVFGICGTRLIWVYTAFRTSRDFVTLIASVRDYDRMNRIFEKYKPQIVFHAAAHKHVPLMEASPTEAIKNNVIGTFNTATLAQFHNVEKFVMISTDKAVNPTNVMGASKRCCEMVVQYLSQQKDGTTEFITTRFGNVLGSNGSVIPLFKKQIEQGKPVTVTHPDIIRYFMTIPEAVSLVMEAAAIADGGEIFVLDMGQPVRITSLAENLIRMYGKIPYKDVEIKFTGLRPGEKIKEELLMDEEGLQKTSNKLIFIGKQIEIDTKLFEKQLYALNIAAGENNDQLAIEALHKIVPTFVSPEEFNKKAMV